MRVRGRLLVGALSGAAMVAGAVAPTAVAAPGPEPSVADQLGSAIAPLRDADHSDIVAARAGDLIIEHGAVLVDVYVSGDPDAAAKRLESLGMDVAATATDPVPVVEGALPLDSLPDAAKLGLTTSVLAVQGGGLDTGSVTSQGVAAHNVPAAQTAAGTTGAGVDVGVISDSINRLGSGVAGSQATNDLPANTIVLKDGAPGSSDEGRAMAEIIYDEAPGVNSIMFASGTVAGAVGKADSINQLTAAGADVIADDIFLLGEPFFQDGVVSQAVDSAKAAGVAYFASAGNRARQSWEGTYNNSAGFENFSAGDTTQTIASVPAGAFFQVTLQWDEPWGAAQTNIDALLRTSAGAALPGVPAPSGGVDVNTTTGLPRESVSWTNNSAAAVNVGLRIQRVSGTASPFMKYIARGNFGAFDVTEYPTNSDTINPDAASARGSMSVAAVEASDPGTDTPEIFSSRGPNTRLFDASGTRLATPEVRLNPDLAAADGVSTTLPPASGLNPFFGTSAATPSAAGIAAILRSFDPNATVNEIYAQMSDPFNSIDCTASTVVPDPDCGGGFILADRAVAGLDRTGPVVVAVPTGPAGEAGWFTGDVVVNWTATDAQSPIEQSCPPVTVTTDGVQTLTCTAVSRGGPTTGSATIKRDTEPPSKPKVKGIKKGKSYKASQLPKKVQCKAKDTTSGLGKCKVKGYKTSPGKHQLKAVATDVAGLKSTAKVPYSVK